DGADRGGRGHLEALRHVLRDDGGDAAQRLGVGRHLPVALGGGRRLGRGLLGGRGGGGGGRSGGRRCGGAVAGGGLAGGARDRARLVVGEELTPGLAHGVG